MGKKRQHHIALMDIRPNNIEQDGKLVQVDVGDIVVGTAARKVPLDGVKRAEAALP